jgi:hypothetical protein
MRYILPLYVIFTKIQKIEDMIRVVKKDRLVKN